MKTFVQNAKTYGVGAAIGGAMAVAPSAQAAIDVSAATGAITSDGTSALTAVGGALLGLAGLAVVFKWAKAAFFG